MTSKTPNVIMIEFEHVHGARIVPYCYVSHLKIIFDYDSIYTSAMLQALPCKCSHMADSPNR